MKLGLQVVAFNWPGSPANTGRTLLDIAQAADTAGFASLWVMDHYFQIEPGIGQASVGIQQFIFSIPNGHEIRPLEIIAQEVIGAVAEL